ncbi:PilW family protein [Pseudomonas stutzeri]|nr:PilW family protein [Stutzerimonas stutzeri]
MSGMHHIRHSRSAGFSLIEMMVAMTIGVLILLAVSEVFINNNRTFTELEKTSRQIENGRYAMQLLESELANTGFLGESLGWTFPGGGNIPPVCTDSHAEIERTMGVPVFGENDVTGSAAPSCLGSFKDGSAYLAVRRASTCAIGTAGCDGFRAGQYHLRVSACLSSNPGLITLERPASLDEMSDVWDRRCGTNLPSGEDGLAPTYRYLSRLYYVRDGDILARAELQDPTAATKYAVTPLVEGIERLHFEYGLDVDGSGSVDTFDAAPSGAEWEDVVAVRIWLLARNLEPTPNYSDGRTYRIPGLDDYTPDDGFKRQLYTSTVRLNNVAGRREAPSFAVAPGSEDEDGDGDDGEETGAPADPSGPAES